MNNVQLKSLADKLTIFFFIMASATVLGYTYLTWLISTAASILLAELLLLLLHRHCHYLPRLYHYLRLEYPRRIHLHCDILGPLIALCVAPLFSYIPFDINIIVSPIMTVAVMPYVRFLQYVDGPRDFRVLNVALFTYIAIKLRDQGDDDDDDDDDDLQHLTLNQIRSNLIIGIMHNISSDNVYVMVVWRRLR
ncbi:hypothetical protein P3S68_005675 [Capsicum galapagoense]